MLGTVSERLARSGLSFPYLAVLTFYDSIHGYLDTQPSLEAIYPIGHEWDLGELRYRRHCTAASEGEDHAPVVTHHVTELRSALHP